MLETRTTEASAAGAAVKDINGAGNSDGKAVCDKSGNVRDSGAADAVNHPSHYTSGDVELKHCPYCPDGGQPEIARDQGVYFGRCLVCGATSSARLDSHAAARAWNTRYERTCRIVSRNDFNNAFGEHSIWYECGAGLLLANGTQEPSFCPGCGAEVVER